MLTSLSTIKSRLALTDATYDDLLTNAILAISARFDKETHRTLARTENATHEFDADTTEILAPCHPIESVSKFELKSSEAAGWQELTPIPDYLIRSSCIISLAEQLNLQPSTFNLQLARVTYTGGYVLPGTDPDPGQTPLPPDLENAAVEQVAYWFQTRNNIGLKTIWPRDGSYQQFLAQPLLPDVKAILQCHTRWIL